MEACIEQLQQMTGLKADLSRGPTDRGMGRFARDGKLIIIGPSGPVTFEVEVKTRLRPSSVNSVLHRAGVQPDETSDTVLLCTDHVSRDVGAILRKAGMPYLDTSGNAFLNASGLHVHIEGQTARKELGRPPGRPRALPLARPTGMRVIRAILRAPDLIHERTRAIAATANVSQPTVTRVLRELADEGWIRMNGRDRRFDRCEELHGRWTDSYPEVLRRTLNPIRVRPIRMNAQEILDQLRSPEARFDGIDFGGPMMARELGADLRSNDLVLYSSPKRRRALMAAFGLRPDDKGTVTLLDSLDEVNEERPRAPTMADAVDIHAELAYTNDSRTAQAAEFIRSQHLVPRWNQS